MTEKWKQHHAHAGLLCRKDLFFKVKGVMYVESPLSTHARMNITHPVSDRQPGSDAHRRKI